MAKKLARVFRTPSFRQILISFQTYSTVKIRRNFVIIPHH